MNSTQCRDRSRGHVFGVEESEYDSLPPVEMALLLTQLQCAAVSFVCDLPSDAVVVRCDSVLELGAGAGPAAQSKVLAKSA